LCWDPAAAWSLGRSAGRRSRRAGPAGGDAGRRRQPEVHHACKLKRGRLSSGGQACGAACQPRRFPPRPRSCRSLDGSLAGGSRNRAGLEATTRKSHRRTRTPGLRLRQHRRPRGWAGGRVELRGRLARAGHQALLVPPGVVGWLQAPPTRAHAPPAEVRRSSLHGQGVIRACSYQMASLIGFLPRGVKRCLFFNDGASQNSYTIEDVAPE